MNIAHVMRPVVPARQAIRFGADEVKTVEPAVVAAPAKKKSLNLLQKIALALISAGAIVSVNGSYKANVAYDGKFNLIAQNAEENYQTRVAAIPGMLVLGAGGILGAIAKGKKKD